MSHICKYTSRSKTLTVVVLLLFAAATVVATVLTSTDTLPVDSVCACPSTLIFIASMQMVRRRSFLFFCSARLTVFFVRGFSFCRYNTYLYVKLCATVPAVS